MTITKYHKPDSSLVRFRTLDSDSPVRVRGILSEIDPRTTLFIVSSKSGGTIEPRLALRAVRDALADQISDEEMVQHLVAITDPGSMLERQAREEGWAAVFSSASPTVGGRFSAMSVFGLLPAALVGINLQEFMQHANEAERACSEDAIDNPAIGLASFLYDNYLQGRNKFSFLTQKRGRVLGLWIEQLVAESLGKDGQGILPNIEIDSLLLTNDPGDRSVIMYQTKTDLWDERKNFEMSLSYIDPTIRARELQDRLGGGAGRALRHVGVRRGHVRLPHEGVPIRPARRGVGQGRGARHPARRPARAGLRAGLRRRRAHGRGGGAPSPCFKDCTDVRASLRALLVSIQPGDFFALNAFLPFTGEGRREALELIRHGVAEKRRVVSCLEVGPRYLHSTGQLQKGGPNDGVFLILSADELKDIPLSEEAESLGSLAKAQASGDLVTLASRGRRCVHLHLPDNSGVTLRALAEVVCDILEELQQA